MSLVSIAKENVGSCDDVEATYGPRLELDEMQWDFSRQLLAEAQQDGELSALEVQEVESIGGTNLDEFNSRSAEQKATYWEVIQALYEKSRHYQEPMAELLRALGL